METSTAESSPQEKNRGSSREPKIKWTPHPFIPMPTEEQIRELGSKNLKKLMELHQMREKLIARSREDPYNYGFELPSWKRLRWGFQQKTEMPLDMVVALGGVRSSKSTAFAKLVVEAALNGKDGFIWCFSQNWEKSKNLQQAQIYEMLPPEYRKKTRSTKGYISYTMHSGFTGNNLIIPDTGTKIEFFTYSGFLHNKGSLEGAKIGFPDYDYDYDWVNIGAWLDEYLMGPSLINTLKYRTIDYVSTMGLSFTPKDNFTAFVAQLLQGVETEEFKEADPSILPNERVPLKQLNKSKNAAIVYFPTDENPFGSIWEQTKQKARPESREEKLIRCYGVPSASNAATLPLFSPKVNVLSDTTPNSYGMTFPDVTNTKQFTCYMVMDPASTRNNAVIWAAVNDRQEVFIIREWPDRETYGPWAEFGHPKWKEGPATRKEGLDAAGYVELWKKIEDEEQIKVLERVADSRFFRREDTENRDYFQIFSQHGMHFIGSDGRDEAAGIRTMDRYFSYNTKRPIDPFNRPMMYIHERCGNVIDALGNYTPKSGTAALKDFFDCVRYLVMMNHGRGPYHVGHFGTVVTRQGIGGY